ncbi:MAG: HDOD domain-containing protein [Deltaproteobacteria bacterium]|nr:HDOD domain-containing protein [Deltaproteobacteria bacterium]
MSNAVQKSQLDDLIARTLELPVLPATTQKVLGIMADPDVSIEKIKRLISTDPALTAKILKVANSAFYGSYRNIQNLSQAILRLGLNAVRNMVVATSMKNVYKRYGLAEKLLWEQMIGSALASSVIARHTRLVDPEDAFIGGLLHDIGKVVVNNEFPEKFAKVMERVYNEQVTFDTAERDLFEFSQREVGAFVVKKWGFPENLEFLIKFFDDNEAMSRDKQLAQLVAIIALSDRMCQKFGMGWRNSGDNEVSFGNLPEVLGIEDASMPEILESVKTVFSQGADIY